MRKIKVVHVIIDLDVGGAELMLSRLVAAHSQRFNAEHIVISLKDIGSVGIRLRDSGFQVISMGMLSVINVPLIFIRLVHEIRRQSPDIVQTWMYHSDLIGGFCARIAGVRRVIWGVRSTDIQQGTSKSTIYVRKLCSVLSRVIPDKIVCAAQASRVVHERIGYAKDKMLVISNGFDFDCLKATDDQGESIRSSLGIDKTDIVIGSIGRFTPEKAHQLLFSSAEILLRKNKRLKFLLIGRGLVPENESLMDLIQATNRSDSFVLLGERSDIPACLKAMDIFCLHSNTEGFPNVLGEAMAMGLPCVSTDVGDADFLLGGCGIVIPPRNSEALATALQKLIKSSTESLRNAGEAAQRRIYSEFSMDTVCNRFQQLYEELLFRHDAF